MTDTSDQTAQTEATPRPDSPEAAEDHAIRKVSLDKSEPDNEHPSEEDATVPAPVETSSKPAAKNYGRLNACFNGLSKIGPLVLLGALCCMAWPIFWMPAKGVYCPAEVSSLTAFLHCLADSSWLAPTGLSGDAFTVAQWPAFSWVIGLLALSPGLVESGYLLPTASFLCTFFAVLGVWCLSHAAGFGYRAAFAAGLILLCTPLFAPLPHFVGPATLAACFLMFALVFFCRGWRGHASWFSLPLAFIFTGLAGLAGGFLPLIVPLAASFCYIIWRGEFRRAHRADAIFGFILLLAIFGCWLGLLMLRHINDAYLGLLFGNAWQWNWPIPLMWLKPVAAGILGCLPWILMIFGVSWARVFSTAGKSLSQSRHDNGSALVWISLVIAICLAIFIPAFHPAAVCIACLVCVLLGKAAINLGSIGGRFFCFLAALALIIAGAIILCLSFSGTQELILPLLPKLPVPDLGQMLLSLAWLPAIGGILLAGGLIALIFAKRFCGCGPLIYGILLVIILCQPCRLGLLPDLANMPNTPLVPFATAEARVADALAPPAPALPAAPDAGLPAQEPATQGPDLPAVIIPDASLLPTAPGESEPETPQAATPEAAPEATTPAPGAAPEPETAPASPSASLPSASGQDTPDNSQTPDTAQETSPEASAPDVVIEVVPVPEPVPVPAEPNPAP